MKITSQTKVTSANTQLAAAAIQSALENGGIPAALVVSHNGRRRYIDVSHAHDRFGVLRSEGGEQGDLGNQFPIDIVKIALNINDGLGNIIATLDLFIRGLVQLLNKFVDIFFLDRNPRSISVSAVGKKKGCAFF